MFPTIQMSVVILVTFLSFLTLSVGVPYNRIGGSSKERKISHFSLGNQRAEGYVVRFPTKRNDPKHESENQTTKTANFNKDSEAKTVHKDSCDRVPIEERVNRDCGYIGITRIECEESNCCWDPVTAESARNMKSNVPFCYYSKGCSGYTVRNASSTAFGRSTSRVDKSDSHVHKEHIEEHVLQLNQTASEGCHRYSDDLAELKVRAQIMQGGKIGRVWIGDVEEKRWQVPGVVSYPIPSTRSPPATPEFTFHYHRKPFEFWIERATDKTIIFDTRGYEFVFEDQYIEITTSIPDNANIFGLGEVIHALRRDPHATRQAMWTLDTATPVDSNLYGAHPFYLEMRNRSAHGVLLLNSNGMDVVMQNNRITYKIIGGVLDFWFMMGPTPIEVIQQYSELIGRPPLPSYWSFGFHQCRYGYESLDQVKNVVKGFKDANIPLETMWIDIDYMEIFKDFTFSPFFPAEHMKEFAEQLHNDSQRMVLIVDPAIKIESGYKVYETGLRDDVFVKNKNGDVLVGRVVCISHSLPGLTAYPDFFNPATKNWWKQSIKDFLDQVPVDGLWIDMNEPSNFCNGECKEDFGVGTTNENSVDPSSDELNNPPYKIDNGGIHAPLTTKTYSMDARHFNGTLAYDVHNLYGFSESKVTYQALKELGFDRPFVLSRSTFVGSGKYAGHWGGDNWSNWEHLYYSIPTVLSFQMFGIPYVGVDICGFIGDASEELCARWMSMGAFFPFSRNHNSIGYQPQEPYLWDTVAEASRQALEIRYSLLPYFYTLFWMNSMTGIPPLRPLWMEWTDDEKLLYFDRQFLIGGGLLISPVLTPNTERMDVYLPKAKWYDYRTHTPLQASDSYIDIKTPLTHIPIHVRGGNVIPRQYPGYTTTECRRNNWTVLVALDEEGTAKGKLYIDDGNGDPETIRTTKAFQLVNFTAENQRFKVDILENGYEVETWIDEIVILGVYSTFTKVTLVTDSRKIVLRNQEWYYDERKLKLVLWVNRQHLNWNKSWKVNWE